MFFVLSEALSFSLICQISQNVSTTHSFHSQQWNSRQSTKKTVSPLGKRSLNDSRQTDSHQFFNSKKDVDTQMIDTNIIIDHNEQQSSQIQSNSNTKRQKYQRMNSGNKKWIKKNSILENDQTITAPTTTTTMAQRYGMKVCLFLSPIFLQSQWVFLVEKTVTKKETCESV